MARQHNDYDQQASDYSNALAHEQMRVIAEIMGVDHLPMKNPRYDFYRAVFVALAARSETSGPDLSEDASRIVQDLFQKIRKNKETKKDEWVAGKMYKYPAYVAQQLEETGNFPTFDQYFQMNVKQQASTYVRDQGRKRKLSPIFHGVQKNDFGVGEQEIGSYPSAVDELSQMEEMVRRDKAIDEVPNILAKHRYGDILIEIWRMMTSAPEGSKKDKYVGREMKLELDELGFLTPTDAKLVEEFARNNPDNPNPYEVLMAKGVLNHKGDYSGWSGGAVSNMKDLVMELIHAHLEDQGIDWESVIASRVSSRRNSGK